MKRRATIAIFGITLVIGGTAIAMTVKLNKYQEAFEETRVGDNAAAAISRFGAPSIRETQTVISYRYADKPCMSPCFERLTWENPLLPGIQAWTIEIDANRKVVGKAYWDSP